MPARSFSFFAPLREIFLGGGENVPFKGGGRLLGRAAWSELSRERRGDFLGNSFLAGGVEGV